MADATRKKSNVLSKAKTTCKSSTRSCQLLPASSLATARCFHFKISKLVIFWQLSITGWVRWRKNELPRYKKLPCSVYYKWNAFNIFNTRRKLLVILFNFSRQFWAFVCLLNWTMVWSYFMYMSKVYGFMLCLTSSMCSCVCRIK